MYFPPSCIRLHPVAQKTQGPFPCFSTHIEDSIAVPPRKSSVLDYVGTKEAERVKEEKHRFSILMSQPSVTVHELHFVYYRTCSYIGAVSATRTSQKDLHSLRPHLDLIPFTVADIRSISNLSRGGILLISNNRGQQLPRLTIQIPYVHLFYLFSGFSRTNDWV